MDILVRNSQAASIYQAFVATGEWLGVDESSMPTFIMGGDLPEYRSVQRLKRYDDKWYIRLCTEDSYRISVDTKIRVPHVLAFNSVLVESEFHHNTLDRRPYLLTDEKKKIHKGSAGHISRLHTNHPGVYRLVSRYYPRYGLHRTQTTTNGYGLFGPVSGFQLASPAG